MYWLLRSLWALRYALAVCIVTALLVVSFERGNPEKTKAGFILMMIVVVAGTLLGAFWQYHEAKEDIEIALTPNGMARHMVWGEISKDTKNPISPKVCDRLIEKMAKRGDVIIDARGWCTLSEEKMDEIEDEAEDW